MTAKERNGNGGAPRTLQITPADHLLGDAGCEVAIICYGDYAIPQCKQAHLASMEVIAEFSGQTCYVYRHYVNKSDRNSYVVAMASEAAAAQGRFWDFHELIMDANEELTSAAVVSFAQTAGVQIERFLKEISGEMYADKLREDLVSGARERIIAVPSVFVNGRLLSSFDQDAIVRAVRRELDKV